MLLKTIYQILFYVYFLAPRALARSKGGIQGVQKNCPLCLERLGGICLFFFSFLLPAFLMSSTCGMWGAFRAESHTLTAQNLLPSTTHGDPPPHPQTHPVHRASSKAMGAQETHRKVSICCSHR